MISDATQQAQEKKVLNRVEDDHAELDYSVLMDEELKDYYYEKKEFLSAVVEEFIPREMTAEKLDQIAGTPSFAWDLETLQKSFFDTIRTYIDRSPGFVESTFLTAALEGLSCDIEKYRLLIPIPEYIIVAAIMSMDICNNRQMRWGRPTAHLTHPRELASIASYFLWTLISYPLVNNLLELDDETRLRLYEAFTYATFKTGIGVGMKLWLRQKDSPIVSEDEHLESYVNEAAGFLRLCMEVVGILAKRPREDIEELLDWAVYTSLAFRLTRDLWNATKTNDLGEADPEIWGKDNHLVIAAFARADEDERRVLQDLSHQKHASKEQKNQLVSMLYSLEAPETTREKINKFLELARERLGKSILDARYRELFQAYSRFLTRLARDGRF